MDELTARFWNLVDGDAGLQESLGDERMHLRAEQFWGSFSEAFDPDELPASTTIGGRWERHPYDMAVERLEQFLSEFSVATERREVRWGSFPDQTQRALDKLVPYAVRAIVGDENHVDMGGIFGGGNQSSKLLRRSGGAEAVFALAKRFSSAMEESEGSRWTGRDWESFEDSVRGGVNSDQDESQHAFAESLLDGLREYTGNDGSPTLPEYFDLLLVQRYDGARYARWRQEKASAFPTGIFRDPLEMAWNILVFICSQSELEGVTDREAEARRTAAQMYAMERLAANAPDDAGVRHALLAVATEAIESTEKQVLKIPSVGRARKNASWEDALFLATLACCIGSRREDAFRYCERRFGRRAPHTGEFYGASNDEGSADLDRQGDGSAISHVLAVVSADGEIQGIRALYGSTDKGKIKLGDRSFYLQSDRRRTRFSAPAKDGGACLVEADLDDQNGPRVLFSSDSMPLGARIEREGKRANAAFEPFAGKLRTPAWYGLGTFEFLANDDEAAFGLKLLDFERPLYLSVHPQSSQGHHVVPLDGGFRARRLLIAGAHPGNRLYTRPFLDFSESDHPDLEDGIGNLVLQAIPENERLIRDSKDSIEEGGCHVLYITDGNVARLNSDRDEPEGWFGGQCYIVWTISRGWVLTQISGRSFTVVSRGREVLFPRADGLEIQIDDLIQFVPRVLVKTKLEPDESIESLDESRLEAICTEIVRSADDVFAEDVIDLCGVRWGRRRVCDA